MNQSINIHEFHRAFETLRPNNFSYEGLNALFSYLEDYEESTGEEIELDVIAICCDFTESSIDEIISNYIYQNPCANEIFNDELKEAGSDEEKADIIEEWLNDNTMAMRLDNGSFVYQAF